MVTKKNASFYIFCCNSNDFVSLAVLDKVIKLCVVGAKILDICVEGDKLLTEATNAIYNKKGKNKITKGKLVACFQYKLWLIQFVQ